MSMPAEQMTATMTLAELLTGLAEAPALPVSGVASDSRLVRDGTLFLACPGLRSHGLDYLDEVLSKGAVAVAYDASTAAAPAIDADVPLIAVPALADHLGTIANRFYRAPCDAVGVIGVTGTNGKTTVAWLVTQAMECVGRSCGYVGTLGRGIGELEAGDNMTTPGTVELLGHLAEFRDRGADCAAIEVSSHALDQNRIAGVTFQAVLFTNLTRDHLDYHGDMERYFKAKARLFTDCPAKLRIINVDSEYGSRLAALCGDEAVRVSTKVERGASGPHFLFVRSVVADAAGSTVTFTSSWGDGHFRLRLPGDFNVANAVMVLATLLAPGVPVAAATAALGTVTAPPGRMQRVPAGNGGPAVYVDYAHTPDALDSALSALRRHCRGQLWCVFGCGGERDKGKRAQMAAVAERCADRVVITSDNPRREPPADIIADIVAGLAAANRVVVIEDRAAAIAWAIAQASPNDSILLAGKGHENYQLVGAERRGFSDYGVAEANLKARTGASS
jgi:UDP-N-acetylmuramoyl-L-alanyl-D-glutamate--2,6-diaminopimelate ligase